MSSTRHCGSQIKEMSSTRHCGLRIEYSKKGI
jgi:hypothetical protein